MYRIDECSDLFVDACVRNAHGQLLFMSVYGRDTAIRELQARIHMGGSTGLSSFTLIYQGVSAHALPEVDVANSAPAKATASQARGAHIVTIGDAKRLSNLTGRLPMNLFGKNLLHVWIFDPVVRFADKANGSAWLLDHAVGVDELLMFDLNSEAVRARIWQTVTELTPVPLMAHWREPLLKALSDQGRQTIRDMAVVPTTRFDDIDEEEDGAPTSDSSHFAPLGRIRALRICLPTRFDELVTGLIQDGTLTANA